MFTGLIREIAKVKSFEGSKLSVYSNHNAKLGDSIAVNGACLTVVEVGSGYFSVELSPESKNILAIDNYKGEVHIEPAMMMGDRFEGHIVQGHVDCIGEIVNIQQNGNSTDFFVKLPQKFIKFVIPKGSVTIDGVSLTVNDVFEDSFRLTIIPHTIKNTIFSRYKKGTFVNVETDMFARYVYHMFSKKQNNDITWDSVDKILASY
ncbi:riboflavin synthase [Arcobacter sp. FWKO B]|uniref:riboflavin synthase n=1 Tax=Arcobacter sp. FWKO B TaxID=2593672 RepID=UPI0018A5E7E9|nr:riboflavin synthase [Arcobacter sp. FWKO B]QOG12324.1 riboflavin synthase [Arcobacter sp. FWKO B]